MKKLLIILITSLLALSVLVSCDKRIEKTNTEETKAIDEKKDIYDLVIIKEVVNKEGVSPNGEKVKYIYEVPIINIDKPGAQKINDMFLNLEKDQEERIGNNQSMTLFIKSKAFLNNGIISVVMEIKKPGPGGIYVANYDIENDKEINTKELIEKYQFNPPKLISEINREVKEERNSMYLDYFAETVITNQYNYPSNEYSKNLEEIQNKTKMDKERYVIENIDKLKAYINRDGNFVFIHRAELLDEEFVVY